MFDFSEGGLRGKPSGVRPLPPQVQGGAGQGIPLHPPRKRLQTAL